LSANFGPAGTGIKPGLFTVTDNFMFGESSDVRKYGHHLNDSVETERTLNVIKFRYGIMDGLDIRTATPIYNIHLDRANGSDQTNYGYGDTTVQLRKILLNQDKGDPLYLALDMGVVLPTGSVGRYTVNAIAAVPGGWWPALEPPTSWIQSVRHGVQYASFPEGVQEFSEMRPHRWNSAYTMPSTCSGTMGAEALYERTPRPNSAHRPEGHEFGTLRSAPSRLQYPALGPEHGRGRPYARLRLYQNNTSGSDATPEFKITKAFDIDTRIFN
jgi:hypothetical protein